MARCDWRHRRSAAPVGGFEISQKGATVMRQQRGRQRRGGSAEHGDEERSINRMTPHYSRVNALTRRSKQGLEKPDHARLITFCAPAIPSGMTTTSHAKQHQCLAPPVSVHDMSKWESDGNCKLPDWLKGSSEMERRLGQHTEYGVCSLYVYRRLDQLLALHLQP